MLIIALVMLRVSNRSWGPKWALVMLRGSNRSASGLRGSLVQAVISIVILTADGPKRGIVPRGQTYIVIPWLS